MNVLVVAPHPDDEAIGCGGAMCLHAARGDRVSVVFLTSGELGLAHLPRTDAWRIREGEATAAGRILGVSDCYFLHCPDWRLADSARDAAGLLHPVLAGEEPAVIYLPHPQDSHPDHRAAARVLGLALQVKSIPKQIYGYEIWSPLPAFDRIEDV